VLSGEAEASLSFAGATQDLPAGRYLVCDIGGGVDGARGRPEGRDG
jgi:exopolyphosphatase/pppGpp-phosphohydrolase